LRGATLGVLTYGAAGLGVLLHRGLAAWLSAEPPSPPRSSPTNMPNNPPLSVAVASIILRLTTEAAHA